MRIVLFILLVFFTTSCSETNAYEDAPTFTQQNSNKYCWLSDYKHSNSIENRITVPEGYKRVDVKQGSFADWLRHLPLKEGKPPVHLYNGKLKGNQSVHYAVVDIDVGSTDIQQCADAVMRMRAEYLYSIKDYKNLHFNFTSGHTVGFEKWSQGYRTVIKGNNVSWVKSAAKDDNYKVFKSYCNTIFNYAGTASLSKELKPVSNLNDVQIGDVFIKGGFPGHAVLVVDVCENIKSKKRLFLIQQSYMPAQDIHILKNYNGASLNPWYSTDFGDVLETPEWNFSKNSLMRW